MLGLSRTTYRQVLSSSMGKYRVLNLDALKILTCKRRIKKDHYFSVLHCHGEVGLDTIVLIGKISCRSNISFFFTALMASFVYGCKVGYTESTTSMFLSDSAPFTANKNDVSWMASISYTGTLISVILCFTLTNKVSLKKFIMSSAITFTLAWLLILLTSSVKIVIACLFFYGVASSILVITAHIYFAEIANPDTRAFLILLYFLTTSLGIQVEYALSAFASYRLLAIFPLVMGIITLTLSYFMIESPYYLVSRGKNDEAAENLRWLQDKTIVEDVSDQLASMEKYVDEQRRMDISDFKAIFLPGNLKLLGVVIIIGSAGTTSCSTLINAYGPLLIQDLEAYVDGRTFMHIFNTLRTVCKVLSIVTVSKLNRFKLIFYGIVSSGLIQIICGFCFYLEKIHDYQLPIVAYAIAALILLYFMVEWVTASAGTIVLKTEVFPHRLKEFYVSVLAFKSDWLSFFVVRSYFWLLNGMGKDYLLFSYSCIAVISAIFAYFFLKNTRGKSLYEIRG